MRLDDISSVADASSAFAMRFMTLANAHILPSGALQLRMTDCSCSWQFTALRHRTYVVHRGTTVSHWGSCGAPALSPTGKLSEPRNNLPDCVRTYLMESWLRGTLKPIPNHFIQKTKIRARMLLLAMFNSLSNFVRFTKRWIKWYIF